MKRSYTTGMILLVLMVALIAPAMACHVTVSKSGESGQCEQVTFTIDASAVQMPYGYYKLVVVDQLQPNGDAVISEAPDGTINGNVVTWEETLGWTMGNKQYSYTMTVDTKADGRNTVTATLYKWVCYGFYCGWSQVSTDTETIAYDAPEECPVPAPEFPTLAVPAMMLVGLIGAVLYLRKGWE